MNIRRCVLFKRRYHTSHLELQEMFITLCVCILGRAEITFGCELTQLAAVAPSTTQRSQLNVYLQTWRPGDLSAFHQR